MFRTKIAVLVAIAAAYLYTISTDPVVRRVVLLRGPYCIPSEYSSTTQKPLLIDGTTHCDDLHNHAAPSHELYTACVDSASAGSRFCSYLTSRCSNRPEEDWSTLTQGYGTL